MELNDSVTVAGVIRVLAAAGVFRFSWWAGMWVDVLPSVLGSVAIYILLPVKGKWRLAIAAVAFVVLFVFTPI